MQWIHAKSESCVHWHIPKSPYPSNLVDFLPTVFPVSTEWEEVRWPSQVLYTTGDMTSSLTRLQAHRAQTVQGLFQISHAGSWLWAAGTTCTYNTCVLRLLERWNPQSKRSGTSLLPFNVSNVAQVSTEAFSRTYCTVLPFPVQIQPCLGIARLDGLFAWNVLLSIQKLYVGLPRGGGI